MVSVSCISVVGDILSSLDIYHTGYQSLAIANFDGMTYLALEPELQKQC